MSTHLRAYRKVTALLYRMLERSRIAEDAWDRATSGNPVEPENSSQWPVGLLNFARNKAVELIAVGQPLLAGASTRDRSDRRSRALRIRTRLAREHSQRAVCDLGTHERRFVDSRR
jgi:hypothetical protein